MCCLREALLQGLEHPVRSTCTLSSLGAHSAVLRGNETWAGLAEEREKKLLISSVQHMFP